MGYLNRIGLTGFITLFIFFGVFLGSVQAQYVVTNTNDDGAGSLRQAINDANNTEVQSTISFNIPGDPGEIHTIIPQSTLPLIINSTILDATTQPGYTTGNPKIVLDGSETSTNSSGIRIFNNNSVVRGFSIVGFKGSTLELGSGIFINGGGDGSRGGHTIEANFLGVLPDGTPKANERAGITVLESPGNVIGGRTAAERNVISGNFEGVRLLGAENNVIEGNFIGTNPAGDDALGNATNVVIFGASDNTIGGLEEGSGNVISGGTSMGIRFVADVGTTENNRIQGNLIGTSADGLSALPNNSGIVFNGGAYNNIIGDDSEAGRNIISGNFVYGIMFNSGSSSSEITGNQIFGNYIGLNINGEALGNQVGIVTIDNVGENNIGVPSKASNVISGNTVTGIRILNGTGLKVQNNLIGTSPDGLSAIPNLDNGIDIGGPDNLIGGSSAGERNIISGNGQYGIQLRNVLGSASGNIIQGNFIGTNISGNSAIANEQSGIFIFDAINNTIGGVNSSERNIISGNHQDGILFAGSDANSNNVLGNYIGLNSTGTAAVGNGRYGIFLNSSGGNFIGGLTPGERNIISGNGSSGIYLNNPATTGNLISGNFIGLAPNGDSGIGNGSSGIVVANAPANQITGNVISHNGQSFNAFGLQIFGDQASGNQVRANKIGTNSNGTMPLPNNGVGLYISGPNTVVGGSIPDDGNIISGNTLDGILITTIQGDASETTIQNNLIGVGADGITPMGNNRDGIAISGSSNNLIGGEASQTPAFQNIIAYNGRNGVSLETESGEVPRFNGILGNSIYSNSERGIALGLASRVPNDPDDSDDGPNKLQNFPEIENIDYDDNSHSFDLSYIVPSAPGNSGYPIRVEFFLSEGVTQGKSYLGFDLFEESDYLNFINNGVQKSISLTLLSSVEVPEEFFVTSTATDSEFNTSEFSDTAPSSDPVAGVSYVVTNTNDSGEGSLRWAVNEANNSAFRDTIRFDIPGSGPHTISIESQFVSFSHPVIIDATTQPGYNALTGVPVVVLDGSPAPEGTNALVFSVPTSGSSIKGLSIVGFPGNPIVIGSNENEVIGNYIGILPDGTVSPNTGDGIVIISGSNNTIGAAGIENRNIISGNTIGINIREGATGNQIQNNLIGTTPNGEGSAPNSEDGILITSSSTNIIGGDETGDRNIVSGNTRNGVTIQGSNATGNIISGNHIGVDISGDSGLGNGERGVFVFNSPENTISNNVISDNGQVSTAAGVDISGQFAVNNQLLENRIGTNANGSAPLANIGSGVIIGTLNTNIIENVISGNSTHGIFVTSFQNTAGNTLIEGNLIGVGADGVTAMPNNFDGIVIDNSSNNNIGGSGSNSGNVISGNNRHGINIQGENSSANNISGNYIGLDHTGTVKVANSFDGIVLTSTGGNSIGSFDESDRNIISGNNRYGIHIQGSAASGNNIIGNYIGVDETGSTGIGNGTFGVYLFNAPENQVAANVISHNGQVSSSGGIHLFGDAAGGNLIRSNKIGTDATGNTAIGNTGSGILVRTLETTIGGSSDGDRNIIGGNSAHGIFISTASANSGNTTILNNYIGIGADGETPTGNSFDGINIAGSSTNSIGEASGQTASSPNVVAHNGRNGITLQVLNETIPVSNSILGNSIFSNNFRGIDLGLNGRTPNDPDDSDSGPNNLQNYPVFSTAEYISDDHQLDISYVVPSSPSNSDYPLRVDYYMTDGSDQGKTYLGFDLFEESDYAAFTDNEIHKSIQLSLAPEISVSENFTITATATDAAMNTSEFAETISGASLPSVVILTTPENNAENISVTPTLIWNAAGGAENYTLQLSVSEDFNPLLVNESELTNTQYTESSLDFETLYYWRVRASNQAGDGEWSEVWSFTTEEDSDTPPAGDNFVVTTTANEGEGSLRWAIEQANSSAFRDSITFNIQGNGPHTIELLERLDSFIQPVLIDATVQPGFDAGNPAIVIDGSEINNSGFTFAGGSDNSEMRGLSVVGFNANAIVILSNENKITSNFIGLLPDGTTKGNTSTGILILGSSNQIGGEDNADRNIISGNGSAGIAMGSGSDGNLVLNNFIGTSADGLSAAGNQYGINISNSTNNIIGGTTLSKRNIISGNERNGIWINQESSTGNIIEGNYIGLTVNGDEGLGNGESGVELSSPDNLISGNVISHNGQISNGHGIRIIGDNATNNQIKANRIGTSADGMSAIGNTGSGILVSAKQNLFGGDNPEDGNLISGNNTFGMFFSRTQTSPDNNIIRHNLIGVAADGISALGNTNDGIIIDGSNNIVGGETTTPGDTPSYPNTIAHNGRNGVTITAVFSEIPYSNAILGNSIFGNDQNGIDLGGNGRTPNDADDSDDGPNKLQNFPVISNVVENTGGEDLLLEISYTVPSAPVNSAYPLRIEFFLSDGDNQGKTYLGYDMFNESDFENDKTAVLVISSLNSIPGGTALVSTATDNDGNTSHFSDATEFAGPPGIATLLSPDNGAVNVSVDPILSWTTVSSTTVYRVQLSKSADFTPAFIDESGLNETELAVSNLQHETEYFWRVQASNDSGDGEWSSVFSFTTEMEVITITNTEIVGQNGGVFTDETSGVELTFPEGALTDDTEITFGVYNVIPEGATISGLFVSLSGPDSEPLSFNEPVLIKVNYDPDNLPDGVTEENLKLLRYSEVDEEWSELETEVDTFEKTASAFTLGFSGFGAGLIEESQLPPSVVTLNTPENGAAEITTNPTLTWQAEPQAASYTLQVSLSEDFASTVVDQTGIDETGYEVSGLEYETQYFWRVRATNEAGDGDWSEMWSFTTEEEPLSPPDVVTLLSPEDGAEDVETTPLLMWQASERAEVYELQLTDNPEFSNLLIELTDLQNTEHQIADDLESATTYFWRVRAGNQTEYSEWSESWSFTTEHATSIFTEDLPKEFTLNQNYPNPFNPATRIRFALPEQAHVNLSVFNLLGQQVATLVNENQAAGWHEITFDAAALSSGIYIYRIEAGKNVQTKKMMLIK